MKKGADVVALYEDDWTHCLSIAAESSHSYSLVPSNDNNKTKKTPAQAAQAVAVQAAQAASETKKQVKGRSVHAK